MTENQLIKINIIYLSKLKKKYYPIPENRTEIIIAAIQKLYVEAQISRETIKPILELAARTIHGLFDFKEVAIGLKNKKDGKYRYEVIIGFTKKSQETHKLLEYTYDEYMDSTRFPYVSLSKFCAFNFMDGFDYERYNKDFVNRPPILTTIRESTDQFIQGDYFDFDMYNVDGELIGWIELANTTNGMLPSRESIRWCELFALTLGKIIERKNLSDKKVK